MRIEAELLLEDLKLLEVCLPKVNISPVMSCFKFSKKQVEAFNGVTYGVLSVPEVDFDGLVNAQMLILLLKTLGKKEIDLKIDGNSLLINSKNYKGSLALIPEEKDSPFKLPDDKKLLEVHLPKYDILLFCSSIAQDSLSSQSHYRGITLFDSHAYCTDGYRMFRFPFRHKIKQMTFISNSVLEVVKVFSELPDKIFLGDSYYKLQFKGIYYYAVQQVEEFSDSNKQYEDLKKRMKLVCEIPITPALERAIERVGAISWCEF